MLELLHWHSEEIEHKAVCFDVLKEVDDSYFLRDPAWALPPYYCGVISASGRIYFISQDKDRVLSRCRLNLSPVKDCRFRRNRQKFAPRHLLEYFKCDFHPDNIDDRYLIEQFFKDKAYAWDWNYCFTNFWNTESLIRLYADKVGSNGKFLSGISSVVLNLSVAKTSFPDMSMILSRRIFSELYLVFNETVRWSVAGLGETVSTAIYQIENHSRKK